MASSIFPTRQCKSKALQAKQVPNPKLSLLAISWQYHPWQQKQSQFLLIIHQNGTQPALWLRWRNSLKQQLCYFLTQCQLSLTRKSRILGTLSKLDEFLLNAQIRTLSGTAPGTFRNTDVENQESTGDRSQYDPHPKVEFSVCQSRTLIDSDPDEASHIFRRGRLN